MKHHPDRNNGDSKSTETFKEVKKAYDILSDPQKKSIYDQYGHAGIDQSGGGGGGGDFGDFGGFSTHELEAAVGPIGNMDNELGGMGLLNDDLGGMMGMEGGLL